MARSNRRYDERSLQRLEWGVVLELIVGRCAFAPSCEAAQEMRPGRGDSAAERRRSATEEVIGEVADGGAEDNHTASSHGRSGPRAQTGRKRRRKPGLVRGHPFRRTEGVLSAERPMTSTGKE